MRLIAVLAFALLAKRPDVPAPGGFWKPLPAAKHGDWRYHYPEEGQTFGEYKAAQPTRGTATRKRIYVQPWLTRAPRDADLLQRIRTMLAASFGRETVLLDPQPMPARAWNAKRRQFAVFGLAARLAARLPQDGLFVLAVTDRDIFMGDFDYALGWGSLELRVAVMSTLRVDVGPDTEKRRRRVLSLALHEASHALSLRHCTFFRCLMNGAQSRGATDSRPVLLCPVCRSKLCWNLDLQPLTRYRELARAWESVGLPEEASRSRNAARQPRK